MSHQPHRVTSGQRKGRGNSPSLSEEEEEEEEEESHRDEDIVLGMLNVMSTTQGHHRTEKRKRELSLSEEKGEEEEAVSYTHLTLPTRRTV